MAVWAYPDQGNAWIPLLLSSGKCACDVTAYADGAVSGVSGLGRSCAATVPSETGR